ncbi:MAG: DUF4388 domain-containing protein, partial [Vicinamibacteria bacterium]
EYDLPDLLLSVSRSGKTGRLQFSNAEGDKTLYVKEGKIIFAESSSDDDALGQHLLRSGKITLQDFTRVSKLVEPGKRLGALLVAEGVLEPKDLVPAVVGQVRAIILGLFRRTESWYRFKDEELPRKEAITLDMPVAQLILDGVQLVDSWRRVSKGVGELDAVCRLVENGEAEWSRLELETGVAELLSMLEAPSRLAEVCTKAPIPDFDACRYLWAFRALGWMEGAELSAESAAELAAESSHQAEVDYLPHDEPAAIAPPAAAIAAPGVDLSTTVIDVGPIPQHLLATKVSAAAEELPTPAPTLEAPPRPIPEALARTRLDFDALPVPAAPSALPSAVVTRKDVSALPKSSPRELMHTRLYLDSSPSGPEPGPGAPPAPPSTGEMMEAILEGAGDAGVLNYGRTAPEPPGFDSDSSTRFFEAANALEPPPPDEEPLEDFFQGSASFASLSLDYDLPAHSPAPSRISEIAQDDAHKEAVPLIEATVVEIVDEAAAACPVVEAGFIPPELVATQPSVPIGMENFAMNDPFSEKDAAASPSPAFSADDPLEYGNDPIAASIPRRPPKTEDLDLDMDGLGALFGEDELE